MSNLKYTYFLIGLVILSFVLNPFMKKKAIGSLNPQEFLILNHILITLLIIIYAFYLYSYSICDLYCYRKLSTEELIWGVGASIASIIGSVAFIMLIQKEEVTFIMPNIQPIIIILASIFGYFLFKENMGKYKFIGIIMIIIGSISINYDKIYKQK